MWWWTKQKPSGGRHHIRRGSRRYATKRTRDRWQGNAITNNMVSEVSALIVNTRYEAKLRKKE